MTAFSQECYRRIHVHCEKGEIYGDMEENILTCRVFGGETKTIDIQKYSDSLAGHGGGDALLIQDIVATFSGKPTKSLTTIQHAMQSHAMGFAAEESRLMGGALVSPSLE